MDLRCLHNPRTRVCWGVCCCHPLPLLWRVEPHQAPILPTLPTSKRYTATVRQFNGGCHKCWSGAAVWGTWKHSLRELQCFQPQVSCSTWPICQRLFVIRVRLVCGRTHRLCSIQIQLVINLPWTALKFDPKDLFSPSLCFFCTLYYFSSFSVSPLSSSSIFFLVYYCKSFIMKISHKSFSYHTPHYKSLP